MLRKIALLGFALLLIAAGVGLYFAPHRTLRHMRKAAEAGNAGDLSQYVDYPRLRENLKAELGERIAQAGSDRALPFAALGATFGRALLDPMIDTMVTPQGLALLLAGTVPERRAQAEPSTSALDAEMSYRSFDEFEVHFAAGAQNGGLSLVLERSGLLEWKLTDVELP